MWVLVSVITRQWIFAKEGFMQPTITCTKPTFLGCKSSLRACADQRQSFAAEDHMTAMSHKAVKPPSTVRDAPVMKLASFEARNATAEATSSGRPMRFRIRWLVISLHSFSTDFPSLAACRSVPSVRMGPGQTVLTLHMGGCFSNGSVASRHMGDTSLKSAVVLT